MNGYCEISKEAFDALLAGKERELTFFGSFTQNGAIFEDFKNHGVLVRAVYQNGYVNYYIRDINF